KELLGALESATLKSLDPRVSDWRRVDGPVYSSNSQEDPRFNHPIARMIPHKSVLIQPMRWKGESIGGFALAWLKDHHRFTSDEIRLTEAIALQAAVARENSRLYEAEKQQVAELKRTQAQLIQSTKLAEEYASGLAPVEVDVPRIKQVVLNLINNAVYVMKDRGGSLTIRSSASGDTVQVEVIDTGTGIAPEHMHRIFEPFFTTKPEVSGTGLGLSVSLGIVESHGGSIEVQSEFGKGSTFTVKLP